jgi:cytochrome P450
LNLQQLLMVAADLRKSQPSPIRPGCRFKQGEMALFSYPLANRDAAMFPDTDCIVIDRAPNPCAAFELGIHRCICSNLARMEITGAREERHGKSSRFALDLSATVKWSASIIRCPRQLPLVLD